MKSIYPNLVKILNREKITVMDVAMELCVPTDEVIERLSGAKEFSYVFFNLGQLILSSY